MKFTEIDFDEYKKLRQVLMECIEGNQGNPYRDTNTKDDNGFYKGKITIGIGVNIQDNNGFWGKLVLYYLFDLAKQSNEIEFNTFYTESRLEELVIKQFTGNQSFKNAEFKKLINDIVKLYIKDINTIHKGEIQKHFNNAIKQGIQQYITHPNRQEKINKLNDNDLKITKNIRGEIGYVELRLNKKQAQELLNIMIINYEAITLKHFNDKKIFDCFNAIQEKEQNNKKYYREFIPFVSATYQSPYIVINKNNASLLAKSFDIKSRFLLWATLRYELGRDRRRRILQSMVFNLANKAAMNIENNNEKFDTCASIFKALNLLNVSKKNQTYLEYFTTIDAAMENTIANEKSIYENRNLQKYKTNPDYEFYRSTCINPNEIQSLREILNPYVKYLDDIIPQARFEKNTDFGLFSLQTSQSNNSKDSNESKRKSRFMLHNIYFIDNTNYDEVNQALMAYKNKTNANNNAIDRENILVFIIDKLNKQIQLHRPNNCYLYVVCAKGNDLDCTFCNCILEDSTPENDECELFMLEGTNSVSANTTQSNSQHQIPIIITPLATKKTLLLESTNNTLKQKEAIYNNFIYSIDASNDLYIKDKDSQIILFTLSNYKCYIKQCLSAEAEQHNNSVAYILDTTLYPNKSYSTFGIKLQVKQDQDTFSNKGNFEVHISNINIKQLETQTKNTIIKDTPFFCYNQHSKQITMAKLEDNSVTIRTNMNESIKEQAKKGLINPIFINLSFYPLYNNYIANNTTSQKLQLIANDINKGSVSVTFKIPNILLNNTKLIQSKKKNPQKEAGEILSIKFNGKKIYIIEKGEVAEKYTFQAQSGNSNNKNTMIEEGIYYIKPKEIKQSHTINRNIEIFDISNLGNRHIKLYQNKYDKKHINTFSLFGITTTRYTIYGGKTLGDIQGIDLAHNDSKFFEALQNLTNKYSKELQEVGNVIRVMVEYNTSEMVLEVVRKWEYRGGGNSNADNWATMSQFKLLKNNIELLNGGIVEPAATNSLPNRKGHNLYPEQQQKTAGSDTRIPAGEYKVFWRESTKQVYARSAIDLEFIDLLKLNGICLKNDVRDFSIKPHSINKGNNQIYDNNRKKLLHDKTDNFKRQHDWDTHSHIMPELKAINGTNMGNRRYILIHSGDNGIWSDGCLLPGELENELEPKGHKNNNGLYQETLLKTMQVIKLLIEHDMEAYRNYDKGESQSTIRNFIVKIKEENIKIYPKNRITKWEK